MLKLHLKTRWSHAILTAGSYVLMMPNPSDRIGEEGRSC